MSAPPRVPAVARAATVLQAIGDAGRPMGLAELTKLTGYPKSSVMGVCYALTEERLLSRGMDGTYALGSRVYEFGSTARRAHGRPIRNIGFSYPDDESFFVTETLALRSEATRIGATTHLRSAHQDGSRQLEHIAEFVAADVDLVLVEPVVAEGLEGAFDAAHMARIPVIALGSATSGTDAVVATDNTKAGSLAGAALARVLSGRGRVAVVGGTPVTANADRVAGFLAAIATYPRLVVVATSHGELDAASGRRAAEEILAEHTALDGFFASNDQIALGIAAVLAARNMFVPIVAVDGARGAIEQIRSGGPIVATAAQDPAGLVRAAIELGGALTTGIGAVYQSVYLQPRLIDARNVGDYSPWG